MKSNKEYIPALGFDSLTNLYDSIISYTMPEQEFRSDLVNEAFKVTEGIKALEFGIGTASNAILGKSKFPQSSIVGIDVDEKVLAIAKKKINSQSVDIELCQYDGSTIPFGHNSFDLVYSSLVFHHLTPDQKIKAFSEIYRILRPGGRLVFTDWGQPNSLYSKVAFKGLRLFDGLLNTKDHETGNYLRMIEKSGFDQGELVKSYATVFGRLELMVFNKGKQ